MNIFGMFRPKPEPTFSAFRAQVYTSYMGRPRVRWEDGFPTKEAAVKAAKKVASRCDWQGHDPYGNPISSIVGIFWEVTPAIIGKISLA